MKSVLRSVKPYYFYLICEGKKTLEIGKTFPTSEDWDQEVWLYCSTDIKSFNLIPKNKRDKYSKYLGKVGAKFICKDADKILSSQSGICYASNHFGVLPLENLLKGSCLSLGGLVDYFGKDIFVPKKLGYAWNISNLEVFKIPKGISEFAVPCGLTCKEHNETIGDCDTCGELRPITFPPQSWMYAKEI